ncbi:leucine-rich repeat domain-containing protein [Fodinibius sediminis]|nr:hypothetical protein [Fodinibius sediminis]
MLVALAQCTDSVTQGTQKETKSSLEKPGLIAPEVHSEQSTSLTLEWGGVEEARSFQIQLSTEEEFLSTIADSTIDSTKFNIQGLPYDTTVYWQVRPVIEDQETEWSDTWDFKTTSKPSKPDPVSTELKSPDDGLEDSPTKVKLQWEAVASASEYSLQLADDQKFENLIVDQKIEGTSYVVSELNHSEDYYWRVEPQTKGRETEWSEVYTFTTVGQSANTTTSATDSLPAPSDLLPEDEATKVSLKPTFKWKAVEGADGYILHASHGNDMVVEEQVDGTEYTPSNGLSSESTHYWRVRAVRDGDKGIWSDINEFTTTKADSLPAPVQVSPDDEMTDASLKPTFKWKAVEGADGYILHASHGNDMVVEEQVDGTEYTPSNGLSSESTHYWRVRAVRDGNEGKWSGIWQFTTTSGSTPIPAVSLIAPSDGSTNSTASLTLEWEELTEANGYNVQLATSSDFFSPIVDENVTSASFDVSGLENGRQYFWRVQATGDNNSSNWSSVWSFNIEEKVTNGSTSGSVAGDRQALLDLYEATGGDHWHNNSGWGSGDPSDGWYGIETDANGRVVRVDLFDNGLSGRLPESIGNLTKVRYLNVKKNELSGEIPSSIGDMASLEWLILAGRTYEIGGTLKEPPERLTKHYHAGKRYSNTNDFSGRIPSTIGGLSNLLRLEIANQPNIKGPIPVEIGDLSQLEGLYLSFNDFSGTTLPSSIGNLRNLRHLYIASAQLEGEIPASFQNLTQLTFLNLGESSNDTPDNHLTGELPDFSNFTELRSLVLTDNNLTGEYPHYWNNGNFTKLYTLRFSWNNLTGTLHGFENLPDLKSLGLEGNKLSGSIDNILSVPSNIRIIGLGWNNFTGDMPQSGWPDFNQIKTLYLNDNALTGSISCDFWEKLDNPKLRIAWLKNNDLNSNCTDAMNRVEGNGNPRISVGGNNF